MEHERSEEPKQALTNFQCKKILSGETIRTDVGHAAIESMKNDEKKNSENNLATHTPEKAEWKCKGKEVSFIARKEEQLSDSFPADDFICESAVVNSEDSESKNPTVSESFERHLYALMRTSKHEAVEIAEKYGILANLFDRMVCSIRLLNLCRRAPTFQNIAMQVENLAERKFLTNHLAQMKYLFPEVIQIEKVLVHDVKSLCMKPDLKVTLRLDNMEYSLDPDQSPYKALSQAFRSRLSDFLSTQPKVDDIPEALLPAPCSQRNDTSVVNKLSEGSAAVQCLQSFGNLYSASNVPHLPSSFHKQFSCKVMVPEAQKTILLAEPDSIVSTAPNDEGTTLSRSQWKMDDKDSVSTINLLPNVTETPSLLTVSDFSEGTPVKFPSIPDQLLMDTPPVQTPKRALPTPNTKLVAEEGHVIAETKGTYSIRKPLFCSPVKPDAASHLSGSTEQKRDIKSSGSPTGHVHEDHKMRHTCYGKRQEMLAGLPDLFNTIRLIFRSTNYSLITKKELVHKIISVNLEIEDTSEVEEQLGLLEELVPDWISKKSASAGGFVYCIKKVIDPESVCAKLMAAK